MTRTRAAVASLLALAGCVDVSAPFFRTAAPVVTRDRARADAAERTRDAMRPRIPDGDERVPYVVQEEGGVSHVLAGPLRLDLRGVAVSVADDVPPTRIDRALHGARGWLFASFTGEVYTSATFTGRLRSLVSLRCDPSSTEPQLDVRRSRGRIVFEGAAGELFWSDGTALQRAETPGIVSLAWRGEAEGAMIVAYRTLRITRDGGRTWRDVNVGAEIPFGVVGNDRDLFVVTSGGWRRLDERAELIPSDDPDDTWLDPQTRVTGARALAAIEHAFSRGYLRTASPQPACRPREDEPPIGWTIPSFVVRLPTHRTGDGSSEWNTARGSPSSLGTPTERAFANVAMVPAIVSVTRAPPPTPGHPIALAWRGEDERGSFTMRMQTTVPREIAPRARWDLVAATRTGILFQLHASARGPTPIDDTPPEWLPDGLYWFGPSGVRLIREDRVVALHWPRVQAVALDDGGAVLLAEARFNEETYFITGQVLIPRLMMAIRLTSDGTEIARRASVSDPRFRVIAGLGQSGDRWGLVMADGNDRTSLTLLPLDGGEVPLGRWLVASPPSVCGARTARVASLHILHRPWAHDEEEDNEDFLPLPVVVGSRVDEPGFEQAQPRLATFERDDSGRVCVRRVWGVRRIVDQGTRGDEGASDLWGALRLTARDGWLTGTYDDGRRIATLPVTLPEAVDLPQDP